MAIYFTSDLHIQHSNIIKYCNRPFKHVDEMDYAILERRNAVVSDSDDVYVLGDATLADTQRNPETVRRVIDIFRQFKGLTYIIPGNHDRPGTLDALNKLSNVRVLSGYEELTLPDKKKIVMCHYPMLVWNKSHHGSYMLHGHSHGTLKYPFPARIMDVGVDVHDFTPISLDQVKAKLDPLPYGHHHDL